MANALCPFSEWQRPTGGVADRELGEGASRKGGRQLPRKIATRKKRFESWLAGWRLAGWRHGDGFGGTARLREHLPARVPLLFGLLCRGAALFSASAISSSNSSRRSGAEPRHLRPAGLTYSTTMTSVFRFRGPPGVGDHRLYRGGGGNFRTTLKLAERRQDGCAGGEPDVQPGSSAARGRCHGGAERLWRRVAGPVSEATPSPSRTSARDGSACWTRAVGPLPDRRGAHACGRHHQRGRTRRHRAPRPRFVDGLGPAVQSAGRSAAGPSPSTSPTRWSTKGPGRRRSRAGARRRVMLAPKNWKTSCGQPRQDRPRSRTVRTRPPCRGGRHDRPARTTTRAGPRPARRRPPGPAAARPRPLRGRRPRGRPRHLRSPRTRPRDGSPTRSPSSGAGSTP